MNEKYLSVTQLTRYIKYRIDGDENLGNVFLRGEISNFKAHTRGHFYFTLKDEGARINAIMFASSARTIKFQPQDGMKVLVTGKVSVYEATGNYQIYVNEMIEDGVGNLYIAFEQLKKKLEQEGLFAKAYKQAIPRIPKTVGIITAPTGAAIRDILSTIKRRWPLAKTILFPCLVQGEDAKHTIVKQIEEAQKHDIDVLIVGRGGGSIEDLWPFNEEIVARAIFASNIPVISAVGHEIDFTIADFVADLRAPTPTGAAEMAVPNKTDMLNYLLQLKIRSTKATLSLIKTQKEKLEQLKKHYLFQNPVSIYQAKEQKLDQAIDRCLANIQLILTVKRSRVEALLGRSIFKVPESLYLRKKEQFLHTKELLEIHGKKYLESKKQSYGKMLGKLEVLNPLLTLKRGYTITKKDGHAIDSVEKLKMNDVITVEFSDGNIAASVIGGK